MVDYAQPISAVRRAAAGVRDEAAAAERRRPDVQGLRAVAILLVVAYHAGLPLYGGFTGVDVFFAISGFVIAGSLARELAAAGRLDLRSFYVRRVKRLLPALALMLTAVAAAGVLFAPVGARQLGPATGIAASLFAANAYLYTLGTGYFDTSASLDPLLHTWTLAVEEQFYLVFPLALLLAWRLGRRPLAAVAVAGLSVGSLLLAVDTGSAHALAGLDAPQRFAFYGSPTRAWEFGAGAVVALALPLLRRLPLVAGSALGSVGVVAVALGAIGGSDALPYETALLPVLGACLLLLAGCAPGNMVSSLLSLRPAVRIGDLSYSWYLWHWPLIVFASAIWPSARAAAPAAAVLSLAPAWLSYRYVEAPVRRARLSRRRVARLAAVCVAVPVAASLAAIGAQHALEWTPAMQSWKRAQALHEDVLRGCNLAIPLAHPERDACTWHVDRPRGTVVLVGDSNAGQFTEPFVRAAADAGYDARVTTMSRCPLVDLRIEARFAAVDMCRGFGRDTLAELVRSRPSLVVLGSRSDLYVEDSSYTLRAPSGAEAADPASKARLWRQGVGAVLAALDRAGVPAIVVRPVPPLPFDPTACTVLSVLTGSCSASVPRTEVDERLARVAAAERGAVAAARGATVLSFEDDLCSRHRCSTGDGRYRDGTHLSIAGALALEAPLEAAIRAHAR